ncbi:DUF1853 family protein [Winogradskyella schleiferi]|uniref:DUF1853 family protein n=1 Tax=Winogradskyella schleiferi TaxID=2686078 RepID=UPI0015BF8BEF|nr:DUF1853 family protein [Winogradskyella schleiferi]
MDKCTLLRFQGYDKSFSLFNINYFKAIEQIKLSSKLEALSLGILEFKNQRLGKLVEEFVFFQLRQDASVEWIIENIQIQEEQRTIGELDAIYGSNEKSFHLEIVYKFYLYDTLQTYSNPLSYWIGPNRRDTLDYKLDKLKTKQFPLLFNKVTQKQLISQNINTTHMQQKLCFKAQLFLPHNNSEINIEPLNTKCISGFYVSFKAISTFEKLEFYIPKKLDWLIIPHHNVDWLDYDTAIISIGEHISSKRSPMVWLKYSNSDIKKCFITWW